MMAVLIGLLLQIMEDGWLAPSSLFLFIIILEMFIAALVHPQELYCLPAIIIYYITIPSMYLLLIIYSLFNLNDITWGTRVVKEKQTPQVYINSCINYIIIIVHNTNNISCIIIQEQYFLQYKL